ncbi:MAG: site-specific DNA-methyltransferase [Candidatus Cloacimonetes bacterium HGW-Cloacimonetes-3]|jgi:DNA modification methylase|nr:MAG: site-specific DNA-methyltransferase [Candidatus Cloacimonetes bacterium HGW-Cloacimonetes-3]
MAELIWDGKYKDGKKTAPVKIALPFQTIETVNESVQHDDRTIFAQIGTEEKWYNRLIWGDKKYVLPSLLPEFAGKINLIYIDPPFDTGANFSFTASIPDNPETETDESTQFVKQPSLIEQKAYRDTWGKGNDSYAQWFYETAVLLRELLADNGSIYVHCDWRVNSYIRLIMDELFGRDCFQGQITWRSMTPSGFKGKTSLGKSKDDIFYYTRDTSRFTYYPQKIPYTPEYLRERFNKVDEDGRFFKDEKIGTATPDTTIEKLKKQKRIYVTSNGTLRIKHFRDEADGYYMDDVWTDIFHENSQSNLRTGYATQKPEALLDRIIKASSKEGDIVLDCFCGSGTTAAVAEKLKRKWITCDLGRFAIHTTRKRLLGIESVKPFIVQNLGKYERQQWMASEFDNPDSRIEVEKTYRRFIIELYHGEAINGYAWIHGIKAGRMIHVGTVEAPITVEDIKSCIKEYWQMVNKAENKADKGIDFLGWEFAFDVNQTAKEYALSNKVDIRFKKIPREVLEKKAVEQGDIKFYELAYLEVKHQKAKSKKITLDLTNFIVPTDDIPEEVQGNITHWSQWIDYWAIDWDYQDDTFHNQWQSYRTKQSPKLLLSAENEYEESGTYTVVIKVIDLLGNDTTKSVQIEV